MADFSPSFFDPLSTGDLTAIICRQFEEQDAHELANLPRFDGQGLYAIYYSGNEMKLYEPLRDCLIPLYVGSAQSHNSSTGGTVATPTPLRDRVGQHQRSIEDTVLDVSEFQVRLLIMPDVHIALGENGLRVGYKPVWNSILKGFGNHDPGEGRGGTQESAWDALHVGRARTHGKKRDDLYLLAALANDLILRQKALLGETGRINWSTHKVDAIKASLRPESSARKDEWIEYAVSSHGVDKVAASDMTVRELKELTTQKLLQIGQSLVQP